MLLVAIVAAGSAHADDYSRYVDSDNMPNPVAYLPGPPDSTMIMSNGDYAQWIWGKTMRNTPRGEMASGDSRYGITRMSVIYSDILGIEITEEGTPAIYRFMARAGETGAGGVSAMKHARFRKRPFLLMDEPTWGAFDTYQNLAKNSSYPSSHTMLATVILWSIILVIDSYVKNIKYANAIKLVCFVLMTVNVVCRLASGVHWLTDIIGGILVSATLISFFDCIAFKSDTPEEKTE